MDLHNGLLNEPYPISTKQLCKDYCKDICNKVGPFLLFIGINFISFKIGYIIASEVNNESSNSL